MEAVTWAVPPKDLTLTDDHVHVWRASLDQPADEIERLQSLLSPDEQERADRFHFSIHRDRFIVARGVLRSLLGRYLNLNPQAIGFVYSEKGKPSLAPEHNDPSLQFNLSHSQTLALYAIARNRAVGIDVEEIRDNYPHEKIASQFFSAEEVAVLQQLPPELKPQAFFNCWTRKEAYIKATGTGLSLPLDQFSVSLIPGEPAQLLQISGNPEEVKRWRLQEIRPGLGYAGAIAVSGHGWQAQFWQWLPS